jgi:hypothetical protein
LCWSRSETTPITNSSTSSFERGSEPALWRRFALTFAAAAASLSVALFGLAVVLDPFDTGRYAFLRTRGVPEQGPRTAHASRARDPQFDAAVVGNSHIQLVSPHRLTQATGISFVSLTVPATGPLEHFVLLDYFLRHRARPARAVVLGIDGYWCTSDPDFKNWKPFPFWLYDARPLAYLGGLIRLETLERLPQRIQYALGLPRPRRARPDGYWDYEQDPRWSADLVATRLADSRPSSLMNSSGRFPALERLARVLAALPAELQVVLVRPPVYITSLPEPGTPLAESEAACLAALQQVAAARARTALIDWRDSRPENRRAENYLDHTHYRATLAQALEGEIAQAVRPRVSREAGR